MPGERPLLHPAIDSCGQVLIGVFEQVRARGLQVQQPGIRDALLLAKFRHALARDLEKMRGFHIAPQGFDDAFNIYGFSAHVDIELQFKP
jgi:hypothetical protein